MVGAFIDQRFSLGTNNQGLFVAGTRSFGQDLLQNWRDDGGFAFGVRPGFSLGMRAASKICTSQQHSMAG